MSTSTSEARQNSIIWSMGSLKLPHRKNSVASSTTSELERAYTADSRRVSMISNSEYHIGNELLRGDQEGQNPSSSSLPKHVSDKNPVVGRLHDGPLSPSMLAEAMASTTAFDRLIDYTSPTKSSSPSRSLVTMNRAQVLIDRLDGWVLVLKEASLWLDEVAKINTQSSQQYYQRALPHVGWDDKRVQRDTALGTTVAGLRFLTEQVAAKQKEASEKLRQEYAKKLSDLRKECKVKLEDLQSSRYLQMGELMKRAEGTQRHIKQLDKLCKAADLTAVQVGQDPWLENLYVLCDLKRETDEDNRLRSLMGNIQQQMAVIESRIIGLLKSALQFCYDHYSGELKRVSGKTKMYKRHLEKMDAAQEWSKFVSTEKDLVRDVDKPIRNYLQINYKNKNHRAVMTIFRGNLTRQTGGFGRQFTERFYVLTQCGFLHEFSLNDKITPVSSVFIPNTKVTPSIDINHPQEDNHPPPGGYTIQIKRTSQFYRDKVIVLRMTDRDELLAWSRPLIEVSVRYKTAPTWKRIRRRGTTGSDNNGKTVSTADKFGSSDPYLLKRSATDPSLGMMESDPGLVRRPLSDQFVSIAPINSKGKMRANDTTAEYNAATETPAATVAAIQDKAIPDEPKPNDQAHTTLEMPQKLQEQQTQEVLALDTTFTESTSSFDDRKDEQQQQTNKVETSAPTTVKEKQTDDAPAKMQDKVTKPEPTTITYTSVPQEGTVTETRKKEEKDGATTNNDDESPTPAPSNIEGLESYIPQLNSVVISHNPFGRYTNDEDDDDDDNSIIDNAF